MKSVTLSAACVQVSCVRGEGPLEGVPFIDSFIMQAEPVVDYLTRYSGLNPGDLDPSVSRHHITTMKGAYVKLRQLVDAGESTVIMTRRPPIENSFAPARFLT